MRIRDPGWRQFGSGMEKSRNREKHPGSATLDLPIVINPASDPRQAILFYELISFLLTGDSICLTSQFFEVCMLLDLFPSGASCCAAGKAEISQNWREPQHSFCPEQTGKILLCKQGLLSNPPFPLPPTSPSMPAWSSKKYGQHFFPVRNKITYTVTQYVSIYYI